MSYTVNVLSLARSALDAALSDVLQAWNAAHCDPVIRLPFELVCQCFRLLDFNGRLAVSHVSRAWRAYALADPRMWNEATVKLRTEPVGAEMVAALLRRSEPLPFTLPWVRSEEVPQIPYDFFHLIDENMQRMKSLSIDICPEGMLQGLLMRPAPRLRSLAFRSADGPCVLPHNWGEGCAALVEVLDIGDFALPATFQPLVSVRSFSGSLGGGPVAVNLFACFPGLRFLHVADVTQDALDQLRDAPASLSDVTLVLSRHGTSYADCKQFLRSWHGSRIQRLRIHGGHTLVGAVELFTSVVAGEWHLTIDRETMILSSDSGAEYTIRCTGYVSLANAPELTTHLMRVCSMTLSKELFAQLCAFDCGPGTWDRSLPSLRDVTLILRAHENYYLHPGTVCMPPRPIQVPLLDSVRFVIMDAPYGVRTSCNWIRESFPSDLARHFARERARLAHIIIEAGHSVCDDEDFTALGNIADDVRVSAGMDEHCDG